MVKEITGRHVLFTMVLAFGIIIAVNVTMAVNAVRTFPGLETANSYVASQSFDRDRAAQLALGWTARAETDGTTLNLAFTDAEGRPVEVAALEATVGRATQVADDQTPAFTFVDGVYTAPVTLDYGKWELRFVATAADGTLFRQRLDLFLAKKS